MSEIHALSGAYATHGLDDLESARFERHLRDCPTCRDEVDGMRETVSMLAETTAVAAPAELRARVLTDISIVRPLPPIVADLVGPIVSRRRPGRLTRGLVAAAAAVVVAGTGAAVWHPWSDDSSQSDYSAVDRVLKASDHEEYVAELENGGEATVVRSPSLKQAVVMVKGGSALPDGKVYELWLRHKGNQYQPAGVLRPGATSLVLVGDAANSIGAAFTIEDEDTVGGPHVPTLPTAADVTFEQA